MKLKVTTHKEFSAHMMKNPAFKQAHDDLEFEFQLIRAVIDARIRKGVTQEKLAKKMGTKQSAIARFETGNANPRLSFMKKLTRALDLQLSARPNK